LIGSIYFFSIKIIGILGVQSGFTCPICLVPNAEQSDLSKTWPQQTHADTTTHLNDAAAASTEVERQIILHHRSLCLIEVRTTNKNHNFLSSS